MFVGAGCRVKTSSAQLNKGASSFVSQHHVYHGNFLAEETSFILVDLSHSNQKRFGSQSAAGNIDVSVQPHSRVSIQKTANLTLRGRHMPDLFKLSHRVYYWGCRG